MESRLLAKDDELTKLRAASSAHLEELEALRATRVQRDEVRCAGERSWRPGVTMQLLRG